MLNIFVHILDTIFPESEEARLLKYETPDDFVRHFSPHRVIGASALSSYNNQIIKAAITANKFHNNEQASLLLAALLAHWQSTIPESDTVFVPIPLSPKRLKSRGYNQVDRILSNTPQIKTADILFRTKDTKPQTSLGRTERFSNMIDVFTAEIPNQFPYKRIVIVDDVITTGATLRAAREAIEEKITSDCEIICVAIAH